MCIFKFCICVLFCWRWARWGGGAISALRHFRASHYLPSMPATAIPHTAHHAITLFSFQNTNTNTNKYIYKNKYKYKYIGLSCRLQSCLWDPCHAAGRRLGECHLHQLPQTPLDSLTIKQGEEASVETAWGLNQLTWTVLCTTLIHPALHAKD